MPPRSEAGDACSCSAYCSPRLEIFLPFRLAGLVTYRQTMQMAKTSK